MIKKRGLYRKKVNFFRSKLVLDSLKSKIAFVFMFGVVIVFAGMDVYDYKVNLVNDTGGELMEMGLWNRMN